MLKARILIFVFTVASISHASSLPAKTAQPNKKTMAVTVELDHMIAAVSLGAKFHFAITDKLVLSAHVAEVAGIQNTGFLRAGVGTRYYLWRPKNLSGFHIGLDASLEGGGRINFRATGGFSWAFENGIYLKTHLGANIEPTLPILGVGLGYAW